MQTLNRKNQAAMIGKVGNSTSVVATIHYLTSDSERVDWTRTQHLASSEKDFVIDQMQATAAPSRTDQPIYHYSIAWAEDDNPSRSQMEAVARQTLRDLGLGEHQALIVAHNDHDFKHLHVMANRVHPETGRAWNRRRDYQKIEQSLRPLERRYGWTEVPGHHLQLDGQQKPEYGRSLNRKEAGRVKEGKLPFFAQVRDVVEQDFRAAGSWEDLHDRLAERGLTIQRGSRGTGGKVTDGHSYCNLSKIHRDFSMNKLKKRFGPFQSLKEIRINKHPSKAIKGFANLDQAIRLNNPNRARRFKQGLSKTFHAMKAAKKVHDGLDRMLSLSAPSNPAFNIAKRLGCQAIKQLKHQHQTHEQGMSL